MNISFFSKVSFQLQVLDANPPKDSINVSENNLAGTSAGIQDDGARSNF